MTVKEEFSAAPWCVDGLPAEDIAVAVAGEDFVGLTEQDEAYFVDALRKAQRGVGKRCEVDGGGTHVVV